MEESNLIAWPKGLHDDRYGTTNPTPTGMPSPVLSD
jgi:hypothetical protein